MPALGFFLQLSGEGFVASLRSVRAFFEDAQKSSENHSLVIENLESASSPKTVENFEGLYKINPHPNPLPSEREKIFVDLKNINKRQLEEIGVKDKKRVIIAAEKACAPGESIHNMLGDVTAQQLNSAILAADAMGMEFLGK